MVASSLHKAVNQLQYRLLVCRIASILQPVTRPSIRHRLRGTIASISPLSIAPLTARVPLRQQFAMAMENLENRWLAAARCV
jgi:hypothetical protein